MMTGIVTGLLARDWPALFMLALAGPVVRIGFFLASGGVAVDWIDYASMAIVSYVTCLAVSVLVFVLKRAMRRATAGAND